MTPTPEFPYRVQLDGGRYGDASWNERSRPPAEMVIQDASYRIDAGRLVEVPGRSWHYEWYADGSWRGYTICSYRWKNPTPARTKRQPKGVGCCVRVGCDDLATVARMVAGFKFGYCEEHDPGFADE